MNSLAIGFIFVVTGLMLYSLIRLSLRATPLIQSKPNIHPIPEMKLGTYSHKHAILLISPGGRIIYTSPQVRELFGLPSEQIDLERLTLLAQPNEAFLFLCQGEATSRFHIEEREIEGKSYYLPYGSSILILISFQLITQTHEDLNEGVSTTSGHPYGLHIYQKYTEVLANYLQATSSTIYGLEKISQSVVESLEKLSKADTLRITIWDNEDNKLISLVNGGFKCLKSKRENFSNSAHQDKYSNYLINNRKPLLISDHGSTQDLPFMERSPHISYRSYLGVPLFIEDEVIGTLELGSISKNAFSEEDLSFVYWFSGHIAYVLHNARNSLPSEKLSVELDELLDLIKVFENPKTETILNQEIMGQIASILEVEILGLLEHDDDNHSLFARNPFWGLPPDFVDLYKIKIPEQGNQENSLQFSQLINSSDPVKDSRLMALGLDHPARAAGMHHILLVPLLVNDNFLGYIQAANKKNSKPFDRFDEELMTIIAWVIAPKFNNAAQKEIAQEIDENLAKLHAGRSDNKSPKQFHRISNLLTSGLEIVKTLNQASNQSEMLFSLGKEVVNHLDSDAVLIAESSVHGPKLLYCFGEITKSHNLDKLIGKRNPIHQTLLSGDSLLINNVNSSKAWKFSPLLTEIKAKSFISIPIKFNDQTKLVLLAVNYTTLPKFSEIDEQIIDLFSYQISSVFQYLNSLAETQHHLQELSLLLDFNRQIGSMDAEKILNALLQTVRKIVPAAQAGFIALWDDQDKKLKPVNAFGYMNGYRLNEINFTKTNSFPGIVYDQETPLCIDEFDFVDMYNLSSEDLLRYREATKGKLPIACLGIPMIGVNNPDRKSDKQNLRGVIVLDNYEKSAAFDENDRAIIESLIHQAALSLENLQLQQASEQQAGQLHALNSMASMISSSLNTDQLVASILDLLKTVVPFDTGTLWLAQDEKLTVRAAIGFDDSEARIGLSVSIDDSLLFNEMASTGKPIPVSDVRHDSRFSSLFDHPYISWLGIPMIAKGKTLGVIALEKREANYYSNEKVQLALTFSGQAAVALENANLFEESILRADEFVQRSQRLEMLNRLSNELAHTLDIDQILNICLRNIVSAVQCSSTSAVLFHSNNKEPKSSEYTSQAVKAILASEYPNSKNKSPEELPDIPVFKHICQSLGVFNTENTKEERELEALSNFIESRNIESLFIVPMATCEDIYGLILVQNNQPRHFSNEEINLARIITNQTAITLENARLFEKTHKLTADLENRVEERTIQLAQAHQRSEILLRVTTALFSSLDLDRVLNNTLKIINENIKADHLGCIVWHPGEPNISHFVTFKDETLSQNEDPIPYPAPLKDFVDQIAKNRDPVLINNIRDYEDINSHPQLIDQYCSAIAVPILIEDQVLGILMMFHKKVGYFTHEQFELIKAVTNQIAVAINKSELYHLIREQAAELGNLLHAQEIETSRSQAILESIVDGVMVTDSENIITHFNAAGEEILELDRNELLGKSLDHFIELFGQAGQSWTKTIKGWSYKSVSSTLDEIFIKQLKLDSGKIVSVHLAPVVFSSQFLGTVSIFHDITHQVEVDRLKSEFVANVSHELRTPMTAIKGYVEILLMGATGALSNQQNQFLSVIRDNSDRLTSIVDELLDISRIESGEQALSFQALDLRPILEGALMDLEHRAKDEKKGLEIEFIRPDHIPKVKGDPERIWQIIIKLLDNAYNFTANNGRIKIYLQPKNSEVIVQIADNGIGICKEEQDRVFDRFYRGEHPIVLETSGTGLGLAIVKHLVEMHNGKIWVESTGIAGEGSSFFFTLPIYRLVD